jgi:hypothetical protein
MMANTNNSTQQQSVSMNPAGSSASFLPVVMSPPGQAIEHHEGFAQVLFEGEVDVNDIPSIHICSLSQEPPVVGVHLDVRNKGGGISDQVFERSYLYRLIGTQESLQSRRNVRHPNNGQFVPRLSAWNLVRPITAKLQEVLHQERAALTLALVDENPLTDEDRAQYNETMMASF